MIFQGHIDKVETRKDRTVMIKLVTATEMTDPNELAELFKLNEQIVSVGIKLGNMTDEEFINIPEPQQDFRNEKSPGMRLRAVIFRLWEAKGKQGEFNLFYRRAMENLINLYKEKL